MERLGTTIKDQNLRLTLAFGIGNMNFSIFWQLKIFLTFFSPFATIPKLKYMAISSCKIGLKIFLVGSKGVIL